MRIVHTLLVAALVAPSIAYAETKDEWIALGARIHGAFGPFIPVGIRIGLDAKEKLHADPRGLTVTDYNGTKPPCPCVADGVMIATQASPGQGSLQISPESTRWFDGGNGHQEPQDRRRTALHHIGRMAAQDTRLDQVRCVGAL